MQGLLQMDYLCKKQFHKDYIREKLERNRTITSRKFHIIFSNLNIVKPFNIIPTQVNPNMILKPTIKV